MAILSRNSLTRASSELTAALARVTELLAGELVSPSTSLPPLSELERGIARAVVAIHGIAGLLPRRSVWSSISGWDEFLEIQAQATRRACAVQALLIAQVDALARHEKIEIAALKGVALHSLGVYVEGERPMADLDLLVAPQFMPRTESLLVRLGFTRVGESRKNVEFERLARGGSSGYAELDRRVEKIDLHERLSEKLGDCEVVIPVESEAHEVGVSSMPSKAQLMRHLLLHAAGNMSTRWIRAVQMVDIARLARFMGVEDWRSAIALDWWAYPPLCLVARYFPGTIPATVLKDARSVCPSQLARRSSRWTLTELSASNPRLMAVPAISWCSSRAGAVRYMISRIFPAEDESRSLRRLPERHAFARDQRWFQTSQGVRILLWLFRRPSRPATMYAVRQALAIKIAG